MIYKLSQVSQRTGQRSSYLVRSCHRLHKYSKLARAMSALQYCRRFGFVTGNGEIYPCPECGGHHIRKEGERALLASQVNITFG